MEARWAKIAVCLYLFVSMGARYVTPNFIVTAPTREIAEKIGRCAEHHRVMLAKQWLGKTMPNWSRPCTVKVKVGQIGAGGATTFAFDRGEVFGWRMNVQGPLYRILDSVIPHEVSHTVFACHFRRPLPRWADEGAATLAEHSDEMQRQRRTFKQILKQRSRFPLRQLLEMEEYPKAMDRVLTLYAQGFSLADFLVERGGKDRYLRFLEEALKRDWDQALRKYYGFQNVETLDKRWTSWVMAGSPRLDLPDGQMLASTSSEARPNRGGNRMVRSQTPENRAGRLAVSQTVGQQLQAPPSSSSREPARPTNAASTSLRRDQLTMPIFKNTSHQFPSENKKWERHPQKCPLSDNQQEVSRSENSRQLPVSESSEVLSENTPPFLNNESGQAERRASSPPSDRPQRWSEFPQRLPRTDVSRQ